MADAPYSPENTRIEELRVFDACIEGLKKSLASLTSTKNSKPWDCVNVAGPEHFRELFRERKNIKLPFLAFIISAFRPDDDQLYNTQALYGGVYLGTDTSGMDHVLHMRRIAVDFQVIVTAETLSDITDFTQRWMFREPRSQFALSTDLYNINIRVKLTPEATLPEQDFGEMGNLFTFTLQGVFYPYIGQIEKKPKITKIKFQTDVVTTNLNNQTSAMLVNSETINLPYKIPGERPNVLPVS